MNCSSQYNNPINKQLHPIQLYYNMYSQNLQNKQQSLSLILSSKRTVHLSPVFEAQEHEEHTPDLHLYTYQVETTTNKILNSIQNPHLQSAEDFINQIKEIGIDFEEIESKFHFIEQIDSINLNSIQFDSPQIEPEINSQNEQSKGNRQLKLEAKESLGMRKLLLEMGRLKKINQLMKSDLNQLKLHVKRFMTKIKFSYLQFGQQITFKVSNYLKRVKSNDISNRIKYKKILSLKNAMITNLFWANQQLRQQNESLMLRNQRTDQILEGARQQAEVIRISLSRLEHRNQQLILDRQKRIEQNSMIRQYEDQIRQLQTREYSQQMYIQDLQDKIEIITLQKSSIQKQKQLVEKELDSSIKNLRQQYQNKFEQTKQQLVFNLEKELRQEYQIQIELFQMSHRRYNNLEQEFNDSIRNLELQNNRLEIYNTELIQQITKLNTTVMDLQKKIEKQQKNNSQRQLQYREISMERDRLLMEKSVKLKRMQRSMQILSNQIQSQMDRFNQPGQDSLYRQKSMALTRDQQSQSMLKNKQILCRLRKQKLKRQSEMSKNKIKVEAQNPEEPIQLSDKDKIVRLRQKVNGLKFEIQKQLI